jgi:hypothetical protein
VTPKITISRHTGYSVFRWRWHINYGLWGYGGTTLTRLGARWIVHRELRKNRR